MVRLEYSQIVRRKLKNLNNELMQNYGENKSQKIMSLITKGVKRLETFPQCGTRISSHYDIECDYSYIFVEHNYFFYIVKCDNTKYVFRCSITNDAYADTVYWLKKLNL